MHIDFRISHGISDRLHLNRDDYYSFGDNNISMILSFFKYMKWF